jgi:hypothetical protein
VVERQQETTRGRLRGLDLFDTQSRHIAVEPEGSFYACVLQAQSNTVSWRMTDI